ncbi:PEP-CTERM sorting domain-containing protein [Thiobacillus sp.]|uniref:PEP-CTERM sorting domain-containing protein n=1 Tax=Thiobacillus sp. TaxID=924 RepID=UPI0025ED95C8|nr:PEP-CTERM sorting domain-containing protein [Thiobacillus sp.]MBT9538504.1 DUF1566 domain-containing protein [Thiobacillus sp.]
MTIRTTLIASSLIAASLVSGAAQAALQGRDLNGNINSFEAYYDTVLDITWLANANVNGQMTHGAATAWAANLSFTDGVNTYDNWRLPTVNPVNGVSFNYSSSPDGSTDLGYNISKAGTTYAGSTGSEMAHLFYNTLGNSGYFTPSDVVSGCYVSPSNTCLDNTAPFDNLQAYFYWSATEYAPGTEGAYYFDFGLGSQSVANGSSYFYALAISPGDVAAVPEAETYALMLAGLGLVGWRARRRG